MGTWTKMIMRIMRRAPASRMRVQAKVATEAKKMMNITSRYKKMTKLLKTYLMMNWRSKICKAPKPRHKTATRWPAGNQRNIGGRIVQESLAPRTSSKTRSTRVR